MNHGWTYLYEFTRKNTDENYVTNGKWDEKKYNQYMLARAFFPGYSAYADYQIGMQQNRWYMNRYGLTWGDVMSPWKLPGYGLMQNGINSAAKTLNFVSRNVTRLYNDKQPSRDDLDNARIDKEVRRRMKEYYNVW